MAVNLRRTGSARLPIESGWISRLASGRRDRRAHLEHVGAEDPFVARRQVVRVVLHERRAAGQPVGDDFQRPQHHRRLPVALGAEAVAVGHESLHSQSRKLSEPAEIFEVGGERAKPTGVEERTQAELDACPVAERLVPFAVAAQFGDDVVGVLVLADEGVDVGVGNGLHRGDEIVDAVGVDGHAETHLGLDLVALGHRDLAHVVAETGELERTDLGQPACRTRPCRDPRRHQRIRYVAGHRLARRARYG